MRRFILIFLFLPTFHNSFAQQTGKFTDPRDGKIYKTVKIGDQVWMAQNLAYMVDNTGTWAYDDDNSNVEKLGYLYNIQSALKACPAGWHLPSDSEWNALATFAGENAGSKLKIKSDNDNGTDDYNFSGLLGGQRDWGFTMGIDSYGNWWSSTQDSGDNYWARGIMLNSPKLFTNSLKKDVGCYVRCLKD